MRLTSNRGIGVLILVLGLMLFSCGGGGTTATGPIGNENPPTTQGDITAPPAPSDFPVFQPEVEGAFEDAPLGTNPDYNVTPGGGEEISRGTSKVSSALDPGEQFKIHWMAVTNQLAAGVYPDDLEGFSEETGLNQGPFEEGSPIQMWLVYEVASGNTLYREWNMATANPEYALELIDGDVTYLTGGDHEPGIYMAKFDYMLPVGSAGDATLECILTGGVKASSLVIIEDPTVLTETMTFTVEAVPITTEDFPPDQPPLDDPPDCWPDWINVDFVSETHVDVEGEKELSNVVLQFADYSVQKWDDLSGYTGTFYGTGANSGKTLIGVWVKSGCNKSGDGPGYGEFYPNEEKNRHATMVWEDLIYNADYDYNDMVASMSAEEIFTADGKLIQVNLLVKALARGAGYAADWQFNVESALVSPGAEVQAIVKQFYHTGEPHGDMRLWNSGTAGACVPVFAPTVSALPVPPDHSFATNVVPNTTYIEGDYAEVIITFNPPLPEGTYEHAPYDPELRVRPRGVGNDYGSYIVKMWRSRDDNATRLDSNGRPLAFIVPDTFCWPLERKRIWNCFDGFANWVEWVNDGGTAPDLMWSEDDPVADYFDRALFK